MQLDTRAELSLPVLVPVVVIIGAGASFASGRYASADRPPLTRRLFETDKAKALLRTYVLANNASRVIRRRMEADDTVAFEQALRSLREDGLAHRRQMSLALPPYLQALMLEYSQELYADAERYSVLIDELLKLETHILFVSLNYDTLLDSNLAAFSRLDKIGDYVSLDRKWSLIKPHGSANWFIELDRGFDPTRPSDDLVIPRHMNIRSVPVEDFALAKVRDVPFVNEHGPARRYPAIALPEGPKDELVLPPEHLDHLTWTLDEAHEIDVLCLGYSALDTEVLDLIAKRKARIRRMTIVNRDPEAALSVYHTIHGRGIEAAWPDVFDGSYEEWIDRDGLRDWVREFGGLRPDQLVGLQVGPYPSLTSPDRLEGRIAYREMMRRRGEDEQDHDWLTRPM